MSPVLLAELEVRHSRIVAPTRRVALGEFFLPTDPPDGPLLLAAVVANFVPRLDADLRDDLDLLIDDLERRRRIPQPRLRHRFQTDTHGLARSRHRLYGDDDTGEPILSFEDALHPLPQILGAVYAAGMLASAIRPHAFGLLWRASRWDGGTAEALLTHLQGVDPVAALRRRRGEGRVEWALVALGFSPDEQPERGDVVRRFRDAVRDAHPDHGAESTEASLRITELTDARRILLALAG
ncbi:MAG TPA: hypothetical protein VMZ22_00395 [Acidimicrobiales bacterium]|nr:hypothetical protein [Acidimicrobiales bacterium]